MKKKSSGKINITAKAVNPDDYWVLGNGGMIYINGDWMSPRMTRHGIIFSGPWSDKIRQMRALSEFLSKIADGFEKALKEDKK